MSLASTKIPIAFPPIPWTWATTPSYANNLLDASGEKFGFAVTAPRTGNIRKFYLPTGTVTVGATLDFRLETLDSNGVPSGSLWGTNTNGNCVIANSDDNVQVGATLTADAAVVEGLSQFACIAVWNTGFNGNFLHFQDATHASEYAVTFNTGAWVKSLCCPNVILEYDDGTVCACSMGGTTMMAQANTTYSTTGMSKGNEITVPFACRVVGYWHWFDASDKEFEGVLFDSDGVTELAVDQQPRLVTTGATQRIAVRRFSNGNHPELSAGDVVILGIRTTAGGSSTHRQYRRTYLNSTHRLADPLGGAYCRYAEATNPSGIGSWTFTDTAAVWGGLLLEALDDGAGGGGGRAAYIGA